MNKTVDTDRYIAAIDLGSNSFHMVIAQEGEQGNMKIIDQVKEMVRLSAGLDEHGDLSADAQIKALDCLGRFGQRLKSIADDRVRVVGTNTLRIANNSNEFKYLAEKALGHRISVISGYEEARLVYLGAAFGLAVGDQKRLVVDIGGGSTELIIGKGYDTLKMDSLELGCVSMTRRVFDDGQITKERIDYAANIASQALEPVAKSYRRIGWQEVVGTSGTIKAIDQLSNLLGIDQDWVSSASLDRTLDWLIDTGVSEKLDHVPAERRPVFIGGFIILDTIFRTLRIDRMDISEGALREGVAYDLVGRLHDEDSRFRGVGSLVDQFQPDTSQSKRVKRLALSFFNQVKSAWHINNDIDRKLLIWASSLHEIGVSIAYTQHHLHGSYIIENSNMDGFSKQVQRALALLVSNHKQSIQLNAISSLPEDWPERMLRILVLLRLAVTFYRGRADTDLSNIKLEVLNSGIEIMLPEQWVIDNPLTLFDLETEKSFLQAVNFTLTIRQV